MYEIMLREVLPELSTIYNVSLNVNLASVLLIRQSDSGAPVCARVKAKGGHFEHKLIASNVRPLLVGHSYLF